jgi:PIN domain nuclease of toxin-antitoxin system
MILLLDTHIFIWWATDPDKLSQKQLAALTDPNNQTILSIASMWEMQIKEQMGRLTLPFPAEIVVKLQCHYNQISTLPILERHIWALKGLSWHHRDPFDRLLAAQSIAEGCQLMTVDRIFKQYPVALFS